MRPGSFPPLYYDATDATTVVAATADHISPNMSLQMRTKKALKSMYPIVGVWQNVHRPVNGDAYHRRTYLNSGTHRIVAIGVQMPRCRG